MFLNRGERIIIIGMKRKLYLLAGLGVVLIAIVVFSLLTKKTPASTCQAFITAIERGDGNDSYEMFTERGKSFYTREKWNEEVAILQGVYGNQPSKLLGDATLITNSQTGEVTGQRQPYAIQYGDNKYTATCFTTTAEPDKIDSFSSEVGF
jgi:hypothetical protein